MDEHAGKSPEMDMPKLPAGVRLMRTLRGHTALIRRIAWSRDGRTLASPSRDGTVRLWDLETGECLHTLEGHGSEVNTVAFDLVGRTLVSGGEDHNIRLWETTSGNSLGVLEGHADAVMSTAFDPTARTLASGSLDRTIKLWDLEGGKLLRTLNSHERVWIVAFDAEGSILASGGAEPMVTLWDVASGQIARSLEHQRGWTVSVAHHPKGGMLASVGDSDALVKLWEVPSGRLLRTLEGHTDFALGVTFSVNGLLLASRGGQEVRLWRPDTGTCVAVIPEQSTDSEYPGIAFHPHLPILATVGSDPHASEDELASVIHLWELDLATLLHQQPTSSTYHYLNAKVVLLGDTGVGKSGLSLVLNGQPFAATDSTPGRKVWTLRSQVVELNDHRKQTRETLLWDLVDHPG